MLVENQQSKADGVEPNACMQTAWLIGIESSSKNGLVYADAELSNGRIVSGVGFSHRGPSFLDDGKFGALWDLAQYLTDRGIEVEATS